MSLLGLAIFITLAWAISLKRDKFPWRTVLAGLGLQLVLAVFMLQTTLGKSVFNFARTAVQKLLESAQAGTSLVFGPLADNKEMTESFGKVGESQSDTYALVAVVICGTIILVATVSSLLYHLGILQRIVRAMAWVMQRILGTSGSESLCSAANVFMGQTEAPLVIKPYLNGMTRSEIMTMMVAGMSTIAGGVFAVYAAFGQQAGFADIAGHLLTASVMAAPAALFMGKILLPETEPSPTAGEASAEVKPETSNALDALCQGASDGMKLTINVLAMLIAFTALVALLNFLIGLPQQWAGTESAKAITFQNLLGWLNAPFAFLMGIPWEDCTAVGQVLGERIVLNEFMGFKALTDTSVTTLANKRSFYITTYAICGFANFASIAIQIGGISALAPERRKDLASFGLRAMAGGILVSYINACIAGLFIA
ncbi:MAG: nucleoside transporter C-terminal domain-containing protein [Verrucomicrobiota bacterium]|nr:nucleoside transporter C-terminal domain-containing protein [Verrucomicrobiota bacterium]